MIQLQTILVFSFILSFLFGTTSSAEAKEIPQMQCTTVGPLGEQGHRRVVCADIAAFDQMLIYNRFGSYNPYGMVFALRRDLTKSTNDPSKFDASACNADFGVDKTLDTTLEPGLVRFKDCKRPRPLVLRANEGDILKLRVSNQLRDVQPTFSKNLCREKQPVNSLGAEVRGKIIEGDNALVKHGEADCLMQTVQERAEQDAMPDTDWPKTRGLSFAVQGLVAVEDPAAPVDDAKAMRDVRVCRGLLAIEPGEFVDCYYEIDRTGPYFFSSNAAPSGGEGDGGSITHGLFGAVVVEGRGTNWYRSQVAQSAFDLAWPKLAADGRYYKNAEAGPFCPSHSTSAPAADQVALRHARSSSGVCYQAMSNGFPVLDMVAVRPPVNTTYPNQSAAQQAYDGAKKAGPVEIVHTDLNAIIHQPDHAAMTTTDGQSLAALPESSFRAFSVFFHDELRSFYTRNFRERG